MRLPSRKILRGIVGDAILDRESFEDPSVAEDTANSIASYRDLLPRLSNRAGPLTPADHKILKRACHHARYWREALADGWKGTGESKEEERFRVEVRQIDRVEAAMGVPLHFLHGGGKPLESVSLYDLI